MENIMVELGIEIFGIKLGLTLTLIGMLYMLYIDYKLNQNTLQNRKDIEELKSLFNKKNKNENYEERGNRLSC